MSKAKDPAPSANAAANSAAGTSNNSVDAKTEQAGGINSPASTDTTQPPKLPPETEQPPAAPIKAPPLRERFGISKVIAEKAAKLAKCSADDVIGYAEYADRHVVVVHQAAGPVKVDIAK